MIDVRPGPDLRCRHKNTCGQSDCGKPFARLGLHYDGTHFWYVIESVHHGEKHVNYAPLTVDAQMLPYLRQLLAELAVDQSEVLAERGKVTT